MAARSVTATRHVSADPPLLIPCGADIHCSVGPIRVGRARRTARGLQGEDAAPAPGQADSEARDSERLSQSSWSWPWSWSWSWSAPSSGGPRPGRGPARQPVCRCLSADVGDGWAALAAVDPGRGEGGLARERGRKILVAWLGERRARARTCKTGCEHTQLMRTH